MPMRGAEHRMWAGAGHGGAVCRAAQPQPGALGAHPPHGGHGAAGPRRRGRLRAGARRAGLPGARPVKTPQVTRTLLAEGIFAC